MNLARSRKKSSLFPWVFFLIVWLCGLEAGCAPSRSQAPSPGKPDEVYRPPTAVAQTPLVIVLPSVTPKIEDLRETARPTATPVCSDDLRFLEDVTIPDGAQVAPGEVVDKRWMVENAGSCNWDRRYRLRMVEGISPEEPVEQALYPARSGARALIRVLFTAPEDPGNYLNAWQAFNPQGEAFGDVIYVEYVINVLSP
jgi:hypothetical protein